MVEAATEAMVEARLARARASTFEVGWREGHRGSRVGTAAAASPTPSVGVPPAPTPKPPSPTVPPSSPTSPPSGIAWGFLELIASRRREVHAPKPHSPNRNPL